MNIRAIILLLLFNCCIETGYAEIVTDGSLGPATELNGPDFAITPDLGQQRGSNLFHSFSLFNLNIGEQANFSATDGIRNIIARVTGGSVSSIDGVINSENAGLWMINPSGWVFGSHAKINVNGPFHVSTADGIRFEDGGVFYADLSQDSSLTVSPPVGMSFMQPQQSKISFDESIIERPAQSTLSMTAAEVELNNTTINAPQGKVLIGATASAGDWTINDQGLNSDNTSQFGKVKISNDQFIPFHFGHHININSESSLPEPGKIQIVSGSTRIQNAILVAQTFSDHSSGNIDLQNQGAINILHSTLHTDAQSGSTGNAGDISIRASDVLVSENSSISASTQLPSEGDTGKIIIQAQQQLNLSGLNTQIFSVVDGSGAANTIQISGADINLSDFATIRTTTGTDSDAGNIEVNAGQLSLSGGGTIGSSALSPENKGNGGTINISTGQLNMSGAETLITSSSFNRGGQGGSITINSEQIKLTDSAEIRALSESSKGAGDIKINNSDLIQMDQAIISTEAVSGSGGNININSQDMVLTNSQITTSLAGQQGDGGNISINNDVLAMNTGFIQANTTAQGGRGGDINVDARQFIPSRGLVAVGGEQRIPFVPDTGINVIQAAAPDGVSGEVTVSNIKLNITGEMQAIKSDFSTAQAITENPCQVERNQAMSSLLVAGQGGLPKTADEDVLLPMTIPEEESQQPDAKPKEQNHHTEPECPLRR